MIIRTVWISVKQAKHCNNIDIFTLVYLSSTYTGTGYKLFVIGGLNSETITNSSCLTFIFHKQELLCMLSQSAVPHHNYNKN